MPETCKICPLLTTKGRGELSREVGNRV